MDDLISRQAAVDAIDEISNEVADGYGFDYAKWREYFCELPSEHSTNLAEVGTDCISRQAAINEIERAKVRVYHSIERAIGRSITEILDEVEKDVRGLPPSESKRGYWKYNAKIGTFKVWTCDQCGWNSEAEFNYCPNCGAKMEGEQYG